MKKLILFMILCSFMWVTPVYAEEEDTYNPEYEESPSFFSGESVSPYIVIGAGAFIIILWILPGKKKKEKGGFIPEDNNKVEDQIIEHGIEREKEEVIELLDSSFDHVIQKYLPDKTEDDLLDDFYQIFIGIQKAWRDFDYRSLEKYCSSDLYGLYASELEKIKEMNCQNIMSDFQLVSSAIRGIEEKDGKVVADVYMCVSFKDYVLNLDTQEVIKGDKENAQQNKYDLEFIMYLDGTNTCPNCGKELTSRECSSCHTIVEKKKDCFILNQQGVMGK